MPSDFNFNNYDGKLYAPADNFKIKEHGRRIARGRSWYIWQQILIIAVISSVASYIIELVCGNPLDIFASETVPREYNASGYVIYSILMFIVGIALSPMTYGMSRNAILAVRGKQPDRTTDALFEKYKDWHKFIKTVGIYTLALVKVFLWSLLLFVPGVIKAISYAPVPYLAFDEPDLSIKETLKKSEDMMRGFKVKYFMLMLTFILWQIVSAFTFFILDIWLVPYLMFTAATFYDEMRRCFYNGADPARVEEPSPSKDEPRSPFDGRFADERTKIESSFFGTFGRQSEEEKSKDAESTEPSREPDDISSEPPKDDNTDNLKF